MFSLMESALDAVVTSDDMLDEAVVAIREADLHRRTGRVVDLIGLITEATGLEAEIGEVCTIETGRGRPSVPAEVVGFRAGRTLLMALGDATGIGPGAKVTASGHPFKVDVSDALLGRALDGLGRPLDGKGPVPSMAWRPAEAAPPDPAIGIAAGFASAEMTRESRLRFPANHANMAGQEDCNRRHYGSPHQIRRRTKRTAQGG